MLPRLRASYGCCSRQPHLQVGRWRCNPSVGSVAADIYTKLFTAVFGLLALSREEAIYFSCYCDEDGNPLRDDAAYEVVFSQPLSCSWWSVTLYRRDLFLVPNRHGAYSVNSVGVRWSSESDTTSCRVLLSGSPPGETAGDRLNWICTGDSPSGAPLHLLLRLYRPSFMKSSGADENRISYADLRNALLALPLPTVRRLPAPKS